MLIYAKKHLLQIPLINVYGQTMYMTKHWECLCFGIRCGDIMFAITQLVPAAWAGSTGQCSVYLYLMFVTISMQQAVHNSNTNGIFKKLFKCHLQVRLKTFWSYIFVTEEPISCSACIFQDDKFAQHFQTFSKGLSFS